MHRWIAAVPLVGVLATLSAAPAFALFQQLTTTLSGPAIGGVVPEGRAKCDNTKRKMQVEVKRVNLADGTVVAVHHDSSIGTFTLARGEARGTFMPTSGMCGRHEALDVLLETTIILSRSTSWQF